MFSATVTLSSLSLFQTVKAAPQANTANDRVSEAIATIKSLVSAETTPANKQAASVIGNAFIESRPMTGTLDAEELRAQVQERFNGPVERAKAKILARETAEANGTPTVRPPYDPIGSISTLSNRKASYERAPQSIEIYTKSITRNQERLQTEADPDTISMLQERIDRATQKVNRQTYLLNNFDGMIKEFEALTRSRYHYSGQFLHKAEDGTYSWGDFSVTNKYTGEVAFENNGDGRVKQLNGIDGAPLYFYTDLR